MMKKMNDFLDIASNFFAHRKGLLPLIGIVFVILNFVIQFLPLGWLAQNGLFLHLGIVVAIFGFLLAWAL